MMRKVKKKEEDGNELYYSVYWSVYVIKCVYLTVRLKIRVQGIFDKTIKIG